GRNRYGHENTLKLQSVSCKKYCSCGRGSCNPHVSEQKENRSSTCRTSDETSCSCSEDSQSFALFRDGKCLCHHCKVQTNQEGDYYPQHQVEWNQLKAPVLCEGGKNHGHLSWETATGRYLCHWH